MFVFVKSISNQFFQEFSIQSSLYKFGWFVRFPTFGKNTTFGCFNFSGKFCICCTNNSFKMFKSHSEVYSVIIFIVFGRILAEFAQTKVLYLFLLIWVYYHIESFLASFSGILLHLFSACFFIAFVFKKSVKTMKSRFYRFFSV